MTTTLLVKDVIAFFKKPNQLEVNASKYEKSILVFKVWMMSFIAILFFSIVLNKLIDIPIADVFTIKLRELGVPLFVLLLTLVNPFIEELAFRLPLRYKPSYLLISFVFIAYYILNTISKPSDLLLIGLSILFTVLFILLGYFISQKADKSQSFYIKYYPYIFYGLAVVFGYIHIANFEEVNTRILLLSPLIFLPQILLGLGMGYVRVRLGFWYGVFFHIWHNSMITVFLYSKGYLDI